MRVDLREKFLGGMVGSALGDAIGELAFRNRTRDRLMTAVEKVQMLIYTDDTAMAIGLAEAILEKKRIDSQHLGEILSRNFFHEPWRGYASGPPTIFSTVKRYGITYLEASKSLFGGSGSMGNGAAMRIAPVGLFFHDSERLYEAAAASAQVTHAHPVGVDGAAVQALAVAQAVRLHPEEEFSAQTLMETLVTSSRTFEIRRKMGLVRELLSERSPPEEAASRLGQSVAVEESMPFALYSFLRHPKTYEECLYCAVLNDGDRDTLGAMAGAVSGAYLGIEAIPESWREKLENREKIEALAASLFQISALPP